MTDKRFDPICELEFTDVRSGRRYTARLGSPVFDQNDRRYYCLSEIVGLEEGKRERIYSDSQFGALMLALLRFRVLFEKQTGDLRTTDGSAPHMFFEKTIPWVHGSDVYQRLCNMVDAEIQKIEDERTGRFEGRDRDEEK
jgi:hypothetical protein